MASVRIVDRWHNGLSWRRRDEGFLARTSHALVDDAGRVWLVDPLEASGVDAELAALGTVAGVIVLLDRHMRDGDRFATRYDVPLYLPLGTRPSRTVRHAVEYDRAIPGCPFDFLQLRQLDRFWIERALWWPEHEVLAVADMLGSVGYFLNGAPDAPALGVHPLQRLTPPVALRELDPSRILLGHGDPVTHDASRALHDAIDDARSGLPQYARAAVHHAVGFARHVLMGR